MLHLRGAEVCAMQRQISERLASWKEIFWGKAVGIAAAFWLILGAWDLFKSEFLPEQYQSWTVVKLTPHLSWRTWIILLLATLLLVSLEGAHAAMQKRDKANAELMLKLAGTLNRQKETRNAFAKLMDEGNTLNLHMYKSKDREEFDALDAQMYDWVTRTFTALNESGLDTDARAFCYSGNEPSSDQIKAVVRDPCQLWKQYPMAKLAIYRAKLQEIVKCRNL